MRMLKGIFDGPQAMVTGVIGSSKTHTMLDSLLNHYEHGDPRQMALWMCKNRKQVRSTYKI